MKAPAVIKKKLNPRSTYPWKEWTKDDKVRRFVKGEHFLVPVHNFSIMCHNYARRHGLSVVTETIDEKTIDVRFLKKKSR